MSVTPKWALAILGAVALSTTAATGPVTAAPAARSSSRVERSLAGIRLGTRATTLVKMIGQPTRIELGAGSGGAGGAGFDSGFGAGTGFDSGFAAPGAPMPGGPPVGPPMPGGPPVGPPMPGGAPSPFPGSGSPFALPQPGASPFGPAAPGGEMGADASGQLAVTYVYENFRKKPGFTLHVQIDEDGRVVQVVGTSLNPVSGVATSRGIGFGTRYSTVLGRYGWPQAHTAAGNFIQASYQESAHVAFQFLNGRVARIVVAEVE